MAFLALLSVVLPALALFGVLDADAVWWSFLIGESINLICIIVYAAIRKRGFPFRAKDYLFLRDGFGVSDEDLLREMLDPVLLQILDGGGSDGLAETAQTFAFADGCTGGNGGCGKLGSKLIVDALQHRLHPLSVAQVFAVG